MLVRVVEQHVAGSPEDPGVNRPIIAWKLDLKEY